MSTSQPNQSLANGLACLQALTATGHPLGSREVARMLGMEHTRVNRLLGTLTSLGLVERTHDRKYGPGPAIHILAAQSLHASGLLACALPALHALWQQGFTVALGVLWQSYICYLFHSRPGQVFEEGVGRHELHPALASSSGLALLAAQPDDHDARVELPAPVCNISPDQLTPQAIAATRQRGYGLLRFANGEVSIGAPIGLPVTAAISVSKSRLTAVEIESMAMRLRDVADDITHKVAAWKRR